MQTLRASEAQRIALCPGSARASYGLPDSTSEYAERGNRIHAYLAAAFSGKDCPTLNDEEQDTANRLMQRIEPYLPMTPRQIFVEQELRVEDFPWTGHADLLVIGADAEALLVDWKSGWGEQEEPVANAQLRVYAVLDWKLHAEKIARLRATIANPRGVMEPVAYRPSDLYDAESELLLIHQAAMKADAPRVPSPDACKYCLAFGRATCPETCKSITAVMGVDPDLPMIPAATLADMGRLAKLAEKRIDQVKNEIRFRLERGEEVPGCSIGNPSEVKEIADIGKAFELLPELTQEQFLSACTVSLPKLSDVFAAVRGTSKAEGRNAVETILDIVIDVKPRKGNLKIGG
jgi:hypothetical protein